MTKFFLTLCTSLFLPAYLFAACDPSFITSADNTNDTVCLGVQVDFTNTSNVSGSIISTNWDFGDFSGANTEDASHNYTQAGMFVVTYNITTTGCSNLVFKDTIYVVMPPGIQEWGTNPLCYDSCNGAASIFILGSHNSGYNIEWDDGLQQQTPTAVGLCEGEYVARVRDEFGCEVFSLPVQLFQPPQIIVSAGPDTNYMCLDDVLQVTDVWFEGGTSPYTYSWSPGTNAGLDFPDSLMPTITANANTFGEFTLTVYDAFGCSGVDYMDVQMTPATLGGRVSSGGAPVFPCRVYMYKVDLDAMGWLILDSADTDASGNYFIDSVPMLDVILYARPGGGVPQTAIPTFYGDSAYWEAATHISPECGVVWLNKDINCPQAMTPTGDCHFHGTVFLVSIGKTQTEDPIPLIDVVVKKTPPGNGVAYTLTDGPGITKGQFNFYDMNAFTSPDTVYEFVVNIPGLGMQENYSINVAFDDSLYDNLNFYVDTTPGTGGIFTYNPLGIEPLKHTRTQMLAYPNPFSEECELRFPNTENGTFTFSLFDLAGKLITRTDEQQGKTYLLRTETLEQGIYIAEVRTAEEVFRSRVMKK